MALAIGMLRVIAAASPPSASTHFALPPTPTSLSTIETGTPVHSEVEVRPCVPCTVRSVGLDGQAVAGALDEHDPRYRREAPNVAHGELLRLPQQPVHVQKMLGRIDDGGSTVATLEVKT